jgi:hypothetical protein
VTLKKINVNFTCVICDVKINVKFVLFVYNMPGSNVMWLPVFSRKNGIISKVGIYVIKRNSPVCGSI